MKTTALSTIWDFVLEYYEGYTTCDIIAENDDLQKIVDGEIDEGSCAEDLYNEIKGEIRVEFGKTLDEETLEAETEKEAQRRLSESNEYIYAKAIEGYLKQLKR